MHEEGRDEKRKPDLPGWMDGDPSKKNSDFALGDPHNQFLLQPMNFFNGLVGERVGGCAHATHTFAENTGQEGPLPFANCSSDSKEKV